MNFITIKVQLEARIEIEDTVFVSSCPAIDVFSQGESEEEALSNLNDAVSSFLDSCFERGVLDDVLLEAGFNKSVERKVEVAPAQMKTVEVDIPLELVANAENSKRQLSPSC